jgi:uncharacterized protein YndB with AHSA1/START domain
MKKPDFVYVTYIAADPERVWTAMLDPKFSRQLFGLKIDQPWSAGAKFRSFAPDGELEHEAEVLEFDPPKRLSIRWLRARLGGQLRDMPRAVGTVVVERINAHVVRVTATETHEDPVDESYLDGGREGWPMGLSQLKTLVETGRPMPSLAASA